MLNAWLYNYTFEFELSENYTFIDHNSIPGYHFNRCANYFLPLAAQNDIFVCFEKPCPTHMSHLIKVLGYQPNYIELNKPLLNKHKNYQTCFNQIKKKFPNQKLNIIPWGWSQNLQKPGNLYNSELIPMDCRIIHLLNSKLTSAYLRQELLNNHYQIPSYIVPTNESDMKQCLESILKNENEIIIKDFFGVSGKLMATVSNKEDLDLLLQKNRKFFKNSEHILVEKKIPIKREFSLQFNFTKKRVKFVAATGLVSLKNGQYFGNKLNFDLGIDINSLLKDIDPVLQYIFKTSYVGYLGIDFLLTTENQIKMLEINARHTMGIIAYHWLTQLNPSQPAFFINTFFKNTSAMPIDLTIKKCLQISKEYDCKFVLIHYVLNPNLRKNHLITFSISGSSISNIKMAILKLFNSISQNGKLLKLIESNSLC